MLFNPDSSKPAQEVQFSRKKTIQVLPTISLNNVQVERVSYEKHLGILLDEKRNFKQHIDSSVIKKLRYNLPRKSLVTIYKAFLRPLIDYGDVIYGQPQNESFCEKIESVQYKATLAITGAMQGTSHNKINQELGLESLKSWNASLLKSRRWYKCLVCMFKIMNEKAPNYLIKFNS